MRYRSLLAVCLGVTLLLCAIKGTEARPTPPNGGRESSPFKSEQPEPPNKNDSEKRDQVAKRVETMLMWRLTEVLNLNEQQGAKVFPVVKKYEKDERQIIAERHKVKEDLRKAINTNETENVKRLLDEFTGLNDKLHKLQASELTELKGVLSITQLAEYALFREEFEREVREMIFDARHRGGNHNRPKENERVPAPDGKGPAHKD